MITRGECLYILLREGDLIKLSNLNSDCFSLVPGLGRKSNTNIIGGSKSAFCNELLIEVARTRTRS